MNQKPDMELLFEQGGLRNNSGAKMALLMAQVTGETDLLDTFMQLATLRAANAEELHPFTSAEDGELPTSGLLLGTSVQADGNLGERVFLPTDLLYRYPHVIICGPAGCGKSWEIKYLTCQEIERGEICWYFDSEGDFIDLAGALGTEKLWVIRFDQLRRNPLEPLPEEDPLVTLGRVKTVLREATFMRDGSINLLSELVHKLYTERGVFNGSEDYPCFEDVYQETKKSRFRLDSRRGQYAEVLLSRLGNISDNMQSTYFCKKGFPIEVLAEHSIVFDITGLSRDLAHFFVDDIILWLADWKLRSVRCGL